MVQDSSEIIKVPKHAYFCSICWDCRIVLGYSYPKRLCARRVHSQHKDHQQT